MSVSVVVVAVVVLDTFVLLCLLAFYRDYMHAVMVSMYIMLPPFCIVRPKKNFFFGGGNTETAAFCLHRFSVSVDSTEAAKPLENFIQVVSQQSVQSVNPAL